jgi:hypothetical protein
MPAARSAMAPTSTVGACNDKAAPVEEVLLVAGAVDEADEVLLVAAVAVGESWAVGVVTGGCELTPAMPQKPVE